MTTAQAASTSRWITGVPFGAAAPGTGLDPRPRSSMRRCESKVSPTRSRGPGRRERRTLQHVDGPVEGLLPFNDHESIGSRAVGVRVDGEEDGERLTVGRPRAGGELVEDVLQTVRQLLELGGGPTPAPTAPCSLLGGRPTPPPR